MKTKLNKLTTLSLLLVALAVPACAVETEDESDVSSDDLAASRMQVLGTIRAGETKTVAYTAAPKYRGYTYAGSKGDKVLLRGTASNGAVVRLYVLGQNFKNLSANGTRGGDVSYTLPQDGAYTFAFFTQNGSSATIALTANVVSLPRPASEAPGPVCNGDLTAAGIASLLVSKPAATPADWVGNQNYVPGAVKLGDYRVTTYVRSCRSAEDCSAWNATNATDGQGGRLLGFGSTSNFGIALTSSTRTPVPSGVPGQPCYRSTSGFGIGARAGDPTLEPMTIRLLSTCANDSGPELAYTAVATDHCAKAYRTVDSRTTIVGGVTVTEERALVYTATY